MYAPNLPLALKAFTSPNGELVRPFLLAHFVNTGFYFCLFMLFGLRRHRDSYIRHRYVDMLTRHFPL